MKKNVLMLFITASLILINYSCGSSKKVEANSGAKEIIVPLSGKEYSTNKEFFRAKSSGKSSDMATAKKIAINNAKSEIAGSIKSTIKSLTDNYTNQRTVGNAQDFENKFENLTREVVNQELVDVSIIGEKVFQQKDNSYEYWIAIEISKEALLNGITNNVSKDQKLQVDFDKKKFGELLDQEMQKSEGK